MNRPPLNRHRHIPRVRRRWLVAVAVCALSACGSASSSSGSNTSAASSSAAGATSATSPSAGLPSPAVTVSACSLLSDPQLVELLGTAPSGSGTEHVYDNNYKACTWFDSTQAKQVQVGVNICKCSENQLFDHPSQFGSPMPDTGVGDMASFSSNTFNSQVYAALTAVKGRVGVDLSYRSSVDPSNVKNAMGADVVQILAQFT